MRVVSKSVNSLFLLTCVLLVNHMYIDSDFGFVGCSALASNVKRRRTVSLVTGANGFLGRHIIKEILQTDHTRPGDRIYALVRSNRVPGEEEYWKSEDNECFEQITQGDRTVHVRSYDMLDGGASLRDCLSEINDLYFSDNDKDSDGIDFHVYHVASVFGPTDDHEQTALDNVKGTEDLMQLCSKHSNNPLCRIRVVFTSSMAAVRATNQPPLNGKAYTYEDWNTMSELGANWGASYQWSKMKSEKRAWEICKDCGSTLELVTICPSFVFGPMLGDSNSFSIELVGKWARGLAEVQSRLCVDVRDVAKSHVQAAHLRNASGNRFIVSTEARIPSQDVADALKSVAIQVGVKYGDRIKCDTTFDGGAIKIGDQEVICAERLKEGLGITCRPVVDTFKDMARKVYLDEVKEKISSFVIDE